MSEMDPFETIAFLARSENRLAVLETVRADARTRREIQEAVDASKVTVNRTLNDFEDRGWVVRERGTYRVTPAGDLVAKLFGDLLGTLSLADRLGDMLDELPLGHFDFPLSQLRDADVLLASAKNPGGPVERGATLFRTADDVRVLASAVAAPVVMAAVEYVTNGGTIEVVLSEPLLELVQADDALREAHRDIVAAAGDVRYYDGDLPFTLGIADETVVIGLVGDAGQQAFVMSRRPVVRDWAERFFAEYREQATPLSTADFSTGR